MERPIRILYIDLAEQKTELKVQPDLGTWVGGNGLGRALLKDDLDSGRVIFSVGPLAEVFPAASWTAAVFISPLTRNLGESFSGGELGRRLAAFGYDAVVLDGKAVSPVFLHLSSGGAEFVPADDVWGQKLPGLWELVERRYSEDTTAYAIGPGGEQGVRFAGVYNSKGQGFQRMGLGCVFGGKNLKGLLLETPPKTNFASSSLGELRDELEGQLFDPTEEGLRFKVERRQRSLWDLGLSLESIPVNNFQSTLTFAGGSISTLFQETSSVSCGNCPV
ncbi:MAG: aldehyde ferredoxin oxidoreductase N-terminal domain-containing protein, partial [Patescibacteria group bacterium]